MRDGDLSEAKRADDALRSEVQERILAQERLRELNARLESEVTARMADLTRANTELMEAKERLQELSSRLIHTQEQERGHIARELHDETGQLLTLLRMRLAEMARDHPDGAVKACTQIVDQAVDHTRRLALNLRPTVLDDLGLDAALEWMLGQQAAVADWSVAYHGSVGEERFAADVHSPWLRRPRAERRFRPLRLRGC